MPLLHKTVGSYTLNVNVDDLGNSKPVLIYTNEGFEAIAQDRSGEEGSFYICSSLILNEQLEKISKLFETFPKIISVNAVNNYTTTAVESGDITPIPTIIACESNVSDVLANGSIRAYGPDETSKNTFTSSSTGNTIGEAMNSARLVLSKEADSFLLPHESSGGEIESNSTQTFYGTISYNNSEPGENWALSYSFPDLQFPVDVPDSELQYSASCCIGDSSEFQYFVLITIFYKYINGQWEKIFDAAPFLIDKFGSNYISPIVHTSGDGKYVTCIYSSFPPFGDLELPTTSVPIFCSDDSGKTWNTVIVDNSTGIDEFLWVNFAISKSGKYQTAGYLANSKEIFKSGVYYSIDYGKTWNSNKDEQIFFFLSVTMNYSGTIQYATVVNETSSAISKSIDYGKTWKTIANFDSLIVYSSVSTNSDGSVISLVNTTDEGKIEFFYSTDFGKTISKSTVPILGNLSFVKGNICMNDSGQYQTFGGIFNENETEVPYSTIFYSNDYGKTWFESDILKLSNSPYLISNVATTNSGLYQTASASGIVTNNKGKKFYSAQIYVSETPP